MSSFVDQHYSLSYDMVETQIHLVKGKSLLHVVCVDSAVLLVRIAIVDFETSELWILNAYIHADNLQSQHVRFVSFEWTAYC